ncbi:MAG: M1 family metallopeptidase, partial [Gemmatimonadetes bacterium]|nr:M1 family metallopeptidase [Gemmatimonadota bacterium]
ATPLAAALAGVGLTVAHAATARLAGAAPPATTAPPAGASLPVLPASDTVRRPIPYPVVPPRGFLDAVRRGTRTPSGWPGPSYWQQWTDYRLRAVLSPRYRRLDGEARITYHNRSPDVLPAVYLHLTQNVHAPGAARNEPYEVTGGMDLSRVTAAGVHLAELTAEAAVADEGAAGQGVAGYAVDGTILRIDLPEPLMPGGTVELELAWTFRVPQGGAGPRMGWDGDELFFLAYWYPQMAVYDDVVGWQIDPFLGLAEFYAGFGSYDFTVEVPEGWIVLASGRLQNPGEVLAPSVLERLRQAESSDSVVHVLAEDDIAAGRTTRRGPDIGGTLEYRFRADTARDAAFSATRSSLWDAVRAPVGDVDGDGETDYTRVDAVYRPGAPRWANTARYGRHAIESLSRFLALPYPWPHMSAIEGGGIVTGGMEFPMMTLIGDYNARGDSALYYVTAHEFGHMWVPMIVATDERRYGWLDEGMTSFAENQVRKEFFPGQDAERSDREAYLETAGAGTEGEMLRWTDYQYPGRVRTATYGKPSTVLVALRGLLGEREFLMAYREFIRRWAFKHATPWDFFHTIEDVTGRDLDWFWRAWYYETWILDHAILDVRQSGGGAEIVIRDLGLVPMPALVRVTRQDGEELMLEVPVETWLAGKTEAILKVREGPPVIRVEIDPERRFPDVDRENNVWPRS